MTGRQNPDRCLWCGREVDSGSTLGRRKRYCAQACRQRAYESRTALERGGLPPDAVMLSADERDALQDKLFVLRCAAEDVATAVAERASHRELEALVAELMRAAKDAEALR